MRTTLFVLFLGLSLPASHASTITIGSEYSNNVFPFSYDYAGEYQQVYSALDFSGPVLITAISFPELYATQGSEVGTYSIRFSTTSAGVNGLSTTYAQNIGADNSVFTSGSFALQGSSLTFTGTNPFFYNPKNGNLLLDVFNYGVTGAGGDPVLMFGPSPDTSRVYNGGGQGTPVADNRALVTTFTYTSVTSVTPEPSGVILLGTGMLALTGLARKRHS